MRQIHGASGRSHETVGVDKRDVAAGRGDTARDGGACHAIPLPDDDDFFSLEHHKPPFQTNAPLTPTLSHAGERGSQTVELYDASPSPLPGIGERVRVRGLLSLDED